MFQFTTDVGYPPENHGPKKSLRLLGIIAGIQSIPLGMLRELDICGHCGVVKTRDSYPDCITPPVTDRGIVVMSITRRCHDTWVEC
jgi:hypothetical protein